MLLNYLLILLIIAVMVFLGMRFYRSIDKEEAFEEEVDTSEMDIKYLISETSLAFQRTLKKNMSEDNLSKEDLLRKERRRTALRQAITNAGFGDSTAKRVVKNNIKELLANEKYDISEKRINKIIPFDEPEKLKGNDLFEIVLYIYNKKFGDNGFRSMVEDWELTRQIKTPSGEMRYCITTDAMKYIYKALFFEVDADKQSQKLGHVELDFNDKVEILAQKIYEKYVGLGAVDMLFETTVDGIDVGVSGIPGGSFKAKTEQKNLPFSYESVWITFKGIKMQMQCCSFETQEELVRVCDNIYKFQAPHVLSRNNPKIIGAMITGARITVFRPPFSDSYGFSLRKFDSAESVAPSNLVKDQNKAIPIAFMKWVIRGQKNSIISGGQGTGKTTWLKSLIRFIDPAFSLRVQEIQPELNLRYVYPDRNIISFAETSSVSSQDGLNFQKKTNGDVNIIGEIAEKIQTSHFIQTSMVASLFSLGTHHAKTAKSLVYALANDLLGLGLYKEKKDAIEMVADVVNIDCHLVNKRGNRYIERITEIIPLKDQQYPSQKSEVALTGEEKAFLDAAEYMHRVTDPVLFTTRDIVTWENLLNEDGSPQKNKDGYEMGIFKFHMPSDSFINDVKAKLSLEEEAEFLNDIEMMQKLSEGNRTAEVEEWEMLALEY